ncbi:RNA ligase family protein [Nocardia sp. NPDC051832]|uniref:ATP-dependent DNA ligase n=1 Tax=Nocardia sp. NPDC051832 TaxID=3155673 RepID=UPI003412F017
MVLVPAPMLAISGRPPDTAAWAIEMKWDGARALVMCDGQECRLYSRNRSEITDFYPELAAAIAVAASGRKLILDGEIVVQTSSGTPSFGLLQRRAQVPQPTAQLIAEVPVQLYAFDVLAIGSDNTTALTYLARRARLEALDLGGGMVSVPPYWRGVEAEKMLATAAERHLEGIVSKELESTYHSGRRSPSWVNTPAPKTTEAIVAGWTPGAGMMAKTFGSLVLGAYAPDGQLVYIGNVGTGFTLAARRGIRAHLNEIATSAMLFELPPVGVVNWVHPLLVADVEYREFTGEGLQQPSWRGLRTDRDPADITVPALG